MSPIWGLIAVLVFTLFPIPLYGREIVAEIWHEWLHR